MKTDMKIGTWNIRTLYSSGALKKLIDTFTEYRLDVLAIQEIRWTGHGVLDRRDCSVYYSCQDKKHQFGTGFIVNKHIRDRVIEFKPINERICKLRIKGKLHNISMICAHAPTEDKSEEVKDEFYDILDKTCMGCCSSDVMLILGDFNAKIGYEENDGMSTGIHSLHRETSNNGIRLMDFAVSNNLMIGSTIFKHKDIHKVTWRSPDGKTQNQIDHVLIDLRHRSSLLDVRTYRGANVDSDHFLIISKLRHKISRSYYKKREHNSKMIDVEQLKKPEIHRNYRKILNDKITTNEHTLSGMHDWNTLKQIIIEAAEETIPECTKKKKNQWFDEECSNITKKKNEAYRLMIQKHYTRDVEERYKDLRRQEKRIHKKKKRTYLDEQYKNIENLNSQKEARKFYQLVNNIRRDFNPRTISCKKENNEITRNIEEVLARWREHFKNLLGGRDNEKRNTATNITLPVTSCENDLVECIPPTLHDVELAINKLNHNKSAGPDGIKAELININDPLLIKKFHIIICDIWSLELLPSEWEEGSICPIYKKGDKLECGNYRGITLLNTAFKIFSTILYKRLLKYTHNVIGDYQCAFQKGKSTTNQTHSIRQILERTKEYNIDSFHLFIDFKAAYDSIHREKLLEALKEFGIPKKLINLIGMTLKNVKCRIKLMSHFSEPFYTEIGLRQGDSLSCLLFNLALEKAVRDSGLCTRGTLLQRSVQLLAFADDIDVIGRTKQAVVEAFVRLEAAARNVGLTINEDKTKFMVATDKTMDTSPLKINHYIFESVKQFKYLGTIVSYNNDIKIEIRNRLTMANRCFFGLRSQFKSKLISTKTKISLYKSLIRPVALYGSECWTLNKSEEDLLLAFERKILRRIFGPIKQNNVWRNLYNHEVYKRFNTPNIIKVIKASRIRWLGHIFRYENSNPAKKITFSRIVGTRKRGRPPTRWLDSIENDLRLLGVNRWRTVALDRVRWRGLEETALACNRL